MRPQVLLFGFRCLVAACFSLACLPVSAQTGWIKGIPYLTNAGNGGQLAEAPGGGYFVAGQRQVTRFDSSGQIIWFRELNSIVYALDLSGDGGLVVAGSKLVGSTQDLWIAKIDGAGNRVWQRTYPGPSSESDGEFASSIKATGDGGFVVGASIEEPGPQSRLSISPWILRLNGNGDVLWNRRFRKATGGAKAQPTSDGGLIGLMAINQGNSGDYHPWLVKLDAGGNVQWQKRYEAPTPEISGATSIIETTTGFTVVVSHYDVAKREQAWIFEIDPTGQLRPGGFARNFGDALSDIVLDARATADGGVLFVGSKEVAGGQRVLWIVRLDSVGNVVFERGYVGGIGVQFGYAAIPTSDGGYAALGIDDNGYFAVFKLDSFGNIGTCLSTVSSGAAELLPRVVSVNVGARSVSPVPIADFDGPYFQTVRSTAWCSSATP